MYYTATAFLGRRSVRDTWIAIWVLWLLWALLFLAKQAFGHPRVEVTRGDRVAAVSSSAPNGVVYDVPGATSTSAAEPVGTASTPPPSTTAPIVTTRRRGAFFHRATNSLRERIARTYDLVRDLTLMLVVVVTLNHFGLASGVYVLVMSWIYLAFVFMWAGMLMLVESRIIDVVFGTIQMLLLLAMLIGAYCLGWTVTS